ncbi:MAG TPA: hypothetical protein VEZ71_11070 [Archangium sp.]|nr:hypothetical protein [Archangium sp.]
MKTPFSLHRSRATAPHAPPAPSAPPAQGKISPPATATAAKPQASHMLTQPLDAFTHSEAGAVSVGSADMAFGGVGANYDFPSRPTGAQGPQPSEHTFGKPKTFGTGTALEVKAGPHGKVETSGYTHSAPGHVQAHGKAGVEANLLSVEGRKQWGTPLGEGRVEGKLTVGTKAEAEAGALLNRKTGQAVLHGKGEAVAGAQAELELHQQLGRHGHAAGKAEGKAGAWAGATGTAAFDPRHGTAMVKAGYEAKAGAEAKAQGQVGMGPVTLSGGAGVMTGVGTEFKFGAGVHEGRFELDTDVGCAVGCGLTCGLGAAIDFKRMGRGVKNLFHPSSTKQTPPTTP